MESWVRDVGTGETRSVFGEGMYAFPVDWSPDGTKLLAVDVPQQQRHLDPPRRPRDGRGTRELTPHDDDGVYVPGPWAADGSGFYLLTDEGSEFRGLAFYDLRRPLRVGRGADVRTSKT